MVKPPIDIDLGCTVVLPGRKGATVVAHQLPELSELSQQQVLTILMGHPVQRRTLTIQVTFASPCLSFSAYSHDEIVMWRKKDVRFLAAFPSCFCWEKMYPMVEGVSYKNVIHYSAKKISSHLLTHCS